MRYGDGFLTGTEQTINNNARAKYNRDLYLPYIAPEYRHKTKTETTLVGTVAVCAFCPRLVCASGKASGRMSLGNSHLC